MLGSNLGSVQREYPLSACRFLPSHCTKRCVLLSPELLHLWYYRQPYFRLPSHQSRRSFLPAGRGYLTPEYQPTSDNNALPYRALADHCILPIDCRGITSRPFVTRIRGALHRTAGGLRCCLCLKRLGLGT